MRRTLAISIAIYLLIVLGLTWTSGRLSDRLKTPTGLVQSFHQGPAFESRALFRRPSREISLDFLDAEPSLPRRSFGVRWQGVWYVPHDQTVDFYAGADDRVELRIDGELVLERNAATGLHTTSRRLPVRAGFHDVRVSYEQYGGGYSLNVQWAPAGKAPRSFDPESLYPQIPDPQHFLVNQRLLAFHRAVIAFWIAPPSFLVLVAAFPLLVRTGRRSLVSWSERSAANWQQAGNPSPLVERFRAVSARPKRAILGLYLLMAVVFLVSILQFYQPGTGFTYLIEFGERFDARVLPAVRDVPHYVHADSAGYDGQFYAQLATEPLLRDRTLNSALDSAPYRARRILFSWTAFVLGLGRPAWILQAYASQNILCWLLLGWLLLRWFPPIDSRNFLLWLGCLFSYGLVSSVRYALIDGPSMLLIVLGVAALERGRFYVASGILGIAGLGRETNLLAGVSLLRRNQWTRARVARHVAAWLLVVLPLLLWLAYVYSAYGARIYDGGRNVTIPPLINYVAKWQATMTELQTVGWSSPARFSLFALISLTAQAAYLVWHVGWNKPWWRVGMVYSLLMIVLGENVWAGYPGAATRVLLPMTFAFNVLLPRSAWFWPLFVLGNLTVLQGLETLRVPFLWQFL